MLKKIQMAQAFDLGVVYWVHAISLRMYKLAAGHEVDLNGQLPLAFIKIDTIDKPRGLDAKGCFKKLIAHAGSRSSMVVYSIVPHSELLS